MKKPCLSGSHVASAHDGWQRSPPSPHDALAAHGRLPPANDGSSDDGRGEGNEPSAGCHAGADDAATKTARKAAGRKYVA
jgi:hypothetical protein